MGSTVDGTDFKSMFTVYFFYLQDEDFTDMLSIGARIEDKYAHFFDAVIINDDIIKASKQLLAVINELQSKPQWVPLNWTR